jgi:hypothetical protein
MGYYIDVTLNNVVIKRENVNKALEAINNIPIKYYSWVNHTGDFKQLKEAFKRWRYAGEYESERENINGDFIVDYFVGEKLGDCEILWKTVAPFIENGAEIEFRGEDGWQWKYVFDGVSMTELTRSQEWV